MYPSRAGRTIQLGTMRPLLTKFALAALFPLRFIEHHTRDPRAQRNRLRTRG